MSKIYYSKGLITDDGSLLNAPTALANGVLLCNADGSSSISTIDSILGYTPANDALTVHLAGTETITGSKTFTNTVNIGASSPGGNETVNVYGNINIDQTPGQAGNLFVITDALGNTFFGINSSGGIYGDHIQNLGTSDSPTFSQVTSGDGSSSDSGGLQIATTGGNHAVDVQGNIQYIESYNKTIIRRGSDNVFDSNGAVGVIATAVPSMPRGVYVTPASAALQAMVVRATASQTANLTEWQDSTGTLLASVDSSGRFESVIGRITLGSWDIWQESGTSLRFRYLTGDEIKIDPNGGFVLEDSAYFGIGNSTNTPDVKLFRDGAAILALRDGTSPQEQRIYNTYDGVNNEYLSVNWTEAANTCIIGTRKTGTGTERNLRIESANDLLFDTAGSSDNIYFRTGGSYRLRMNSGQFYPYINDMRLGTTGSPWHGNAFRSGATDPTTSDLDDGYGTTWKNTTSSEIRDWVNDGGVMKKSAAYT